MVSYWDHIETGVLGTEEILDTDRNSHKQMIEARQSRLGLWRVTDSILPIAHKYRAGRRESKNKDATTEPKFVSCEYCPDYFIHLLHAFNG